MKKLLLLVFLIGTTAFHTQGKIREKRSIVRLETAMGNIRIALNDETPVHRDNFLKLVSEGFYDALPPRRERLRHPGRRPGFQTGPGRKDIGRRRAGIYVGSRNRPAFPIP